MSADERELFFLAGIFHRFAKRAVQILKGRERPLFPGRFRDPRRMLKRRADDLDKILLRHPVQFRERVFFSHALFCVSSLTEVLR